jgi:uncharacterized membrane protein
MPPLTLYYQLLSESKINYIPAIQMFFHHLQLSLKENCLYLHDFTTFIDDTLAAELTVLRHSLLFWILCCFRYFSRKWHKIPAGEFVR